MEPRIYKGKPTVHRTDLYNHLGTISGNNKIHFVAWEINNRTYILADNALITTLLRERQHYGRDMFEEVLDAPFPLKWSEVIYETRDIPTGYFPFEVKDTLTTSDFV